MGWQHNKNQYTCTLLRAKFKKAFSCDYNKQCLMIVGWFYAFVGLPEGWHGGWQGKQWVSVQQHLETQRFSSLQLLCTTKVTFSCSLFKQGFNVEKPSLVNSVMSDYTSLVKTSLFLKDQPAFSPEHVSPFPPLNINVYLGVSA